MKCSLFGRMSLKIHFFGLKFITYLTKFINQNQIQLDNQLFLESQKLVKGAELGLYDSVHFLQFIIKSKCEKLGQIWPYLKFKFYNKITLFSYVICMAIHGVAKLKLLRGKC